jgi:cell division protein FtsQ
MRQVIRRDPAPSRFAYRLSRFWASRRVRRLVTLWLPIIAGCAALGAIALHPSQTARMQSAAETVRSAVVDHPSFVLNEMVITGAANDTYGQVEALLETVLPASALSLDLDILRVQLESLPPVRRARLDVAGEGILSIEIDERQPAALLRKGNVLSLVDLDGTLIRQLADRSTYPALPVLYGDGADKAVAEALTLLAIAEPLKGRIAGLVRVGERRWTFHLDRDQKVSLPEIAPEDALRRVLALDRSSDLLARDVSVVDMRNPARPVMRLTDNAVREVRRLRAFRPEEDA